jgi:6-phosphogluconolactonase (cycloisomerase 2 family)
VSPDGKYLYAANRKDDSFAIFACAPADGKLTLITVSQLLLLVRVTAQPPCTLVEHTFICSRAQCALSVCSLQRQQHYSHKDQNTHTRNMQIIEGKPRGDGGPASRHLLVAHQDSDTLAVYQLDVASGLVRRCLIQPKPIGLNVAPPC